MIKKKNKTKELIAELENIYLKSGTEMREKGLYYRLMSDVAKLDGYIDRDTAILARIKDIILELKKVV